MTSKMSLALFLAFLALDDWSAGEDQSRHAEPAAPATGEIGDEEFLLAVDERTARDIDDAVARLGSADFHSRQEGKATLLEIGAPAFARLREVYHETDDLETRLLIEEIIYRGYLNHHVYGRNGFLGIAQSPFPFTFTIRGADGNPMERRGIGVRRVIADTAAERCGLMEEDIIIGVDGKAFGPIYDIDGTTFPEYVRLKGPGTPINLLLVREGELLEMEAILGRRPERYYDYTQPELLIPLNEAKDHFPRWWQKNMKAPQSAKASSARPSESSSAEAEGKPQSR
jgi:hypothetical protein